MLSTLKRRTFIISALIISAYVFISLKEGIIIIKQLTYLEKYLFTKWEFKISVNISSFQSVLYWFPSTVCLLRKSDCCFNLILIEIVLQKRPFVLVWIRKSWIFLLLCLVASQGNKQEYSLLRYMKNFIN